jgi:hypothetical protein
VGAFRPQRLPKLISSNHFPWAFEQQYEELERLILNLDASAVAGQGAAGGIGFEQAEAKQIPRPGPALHIPSPGKLAGIITSLFKHVSSRRTAFNTNGFSCQTGLTGVSFDLAPSFGEKTRVHTKKSLRRNDEQ